MIISSLLVDSMPASLRSKLFAFWLPGVVLAIILIAGYGTYTAYRRDTSSAQSCLQSIAVSYATDVNTELERAMDAARTLSQMLSAVKAANQNLIISRKEVNAMLREVLKRNPTFLAVYTAWEPNAFDGNDAAFANTYGHDSTGRFSPYWSRMNGRVHQEVNIGYDTEGIGNYYQLPKSLLRECILEPYLYPVQGKKVLMTSLCVPIVVDDTFYGICAVDIALDYLQSVVDKADVFDRSGKVIILSRKGTIVGMTDRPELAVKPGETLFSSHQNTSTSGTAIGTPYHTPRRGIIVQNDTLFAFAPMKIGFTDTPWSVVVSVPQDVVVTPLTAVTFTQAYITIAVICALALIVWFFSSKMLESIAALQNATETFATGNLEVLIAVTGDDELGQVGHSFNRMAQKIRGMMNELQTTQMLTQQTRHELHISEQRLQSVIETTPFVAVQFYNREGRITYWNRASEQMYGWSAEETLGKTLNELTHSKEETSAFLEMLHEIEKTGLPTNPMEYPTRRKDGRVMIGLSTIFAIPSSLGGEPTFVCMDIDISEQKRTEEALQQSKRDLDTMLRMMTVGVAVNINNRYVFTNAALGQILGYSAEEFKAILNIEQLIHEADQALVHKRYSERLSGTHSHADPIEVRYRHKAGHDVWVQVSGLIITYQGERATLATFVDTTARRQAEEAVRQSEQNLRLILEGMVVGILLNKADTFIFVNNAICRMLGYERQELLAMEQVWDLVHPDEREELYWRYLARMRGDFTISPTYEVRFRHKQGHFVWTEIAGVSIMYEGERVGLATITNIAERKRAEEQVLHTQENQRKILETMGIGVTVTRGEQSLFTNDAWCRLMGYTLEDLRTMSVYEAMHPDSRLRIEERGRARLKGEDVPRRYEERMYHKSGSLLWVEITAFVIDYGGAPAVIASFVDITERKKAVVQLQETLREKEHLLVEIDHQKNMALRSFIQGQEEERHRIAQDLHDGVGHLLSLVKIGLSSFQENVQELVPARLEEFERFLGIYDQAVQEVRAVSHQLMPATLRKMGLKAALQDLSTMLALSTPIRVNVSLETLDTFAPHLDSELETSIFRIVQELVNNTLKYAHANTVSIQILDNIGTLICSYEDDGIGFDLQNPSGGIGLRNITNRIVLLGGTVEFDSAPGNGMVATIEIPIYSSSSITSSPGETA